MVASCFESLDLKHGEPRRVKPVGFTVSGGLANGWRADLRRQLRDYVGQCLADGPHRIGILRMLRRALPIEMGVHPSFVPTQHLLAARVLSEESRTRERARNSPRGQPEADRDWPAAARFRSGCVGVASAMRLPCLRHYSLAKIRFRFRLVAPGKLVTRPSSPRAQRAAPWLPLR